MADVEHPQPGGDHHAAGATPTVLGGGAWTYDWSDRPRPFVHPVRTPAGHVLTVDAPADHPWHHALWFTIKYVDGDNFWEEFGDFGLLRQTSPPTVAHVGHGGERAASDLEWIRPDGRLVPQVPRSPLAVPAIASVIARCGADVSAETCTSLWQGERMDLDMAVGGLMRLHGMT